jgi:hypothetical protein
MKPHPCLVTDWILGQFGSERRGAEAGYRKFIRDGIRAESIWKGVRAQSVLGEGDFIESLVDYPYNDTYGILSAMDSLRFRCER